jgi:hypothetical protein
MSETKKKTTVKFTRNNSNLKTIKEVNPLNINHKSSSVIKNIFSDSRDREENIFSGPVNDPPTKSDEIFQKHNEVLRTPIRKATSNIKSFKSLNDASSESNTHKENFNNKSQDNIETYLITPFFINNPIIKSDITKIEDFLHEKFKYSNQPICDNERLDTDSSISKSKSYKRCHKCTKCKFDLLSENGIISHPKEFEVYKIFETFDNFARYIIPGNENDLNNYTTNNRKSSGNAFMSNMASYMTSQLGDADKSYIENIINTIDEFLRSILSSTPFSLNEKTNIQTILNTKVGRHCFSDILYQKKFRDNVSQILNEKGFDELSQIIFSSLLLGENEQSQFDDMIKITKSCFYYYK